MTRINLESEIVLPEPLKFSKLPMTIGEGHLERQMAEIRSEVLPVIEEVLDSGKFTLGPHLIQFEEEFSKYCGSAYCIGVSSGTSALHLALQVLEVDDGDEVITACNTYAATAFAISYTHAKPVFVDVDPKTFNITAASIAPKISSRTKVILPVHLYGQSVEMDEIKNLAIENGLKIVEDAAHAHGAEYKGQKTGSLGDLAAFSFFPAKNLGACGDGGAITTSDPILNEKIRILRYVGQRVKGIHEVIGFQDRLDELQAAILSIKLKHLDDWNQKRRKLASIYVEALADTPLKMPFVATGIKHVYYSFAVLAENEQQRNDLIKFLAQKGFRTAVMYPILLPLQKAYSSLGYTEKDFPVGSDLVKRMLNLPIFETLSEDETYQLIDVIRSYFRQ